MRYSEHPHPRRLLLHVSDTHLVRPGELLYGVADAEGHLREGLARFRDTGLRPDALIFTGDLTDRGDPDAYALLRSVVEPLAADMGARAIWVAGNHDERRALRVGLLDRPASDAPHDEVHWIGGLRVVVLDTTVPGHHHGELSDPQLHWLAEVLASPAPEGTVLALHHPPLPCVQDLAITVELREQARLATVLRGSDIRAILGGHVHHTTFGTFAGVPVSVAAATCYTQDLLMPERGTRGRDAAHAMNLVSLYPDTVTHTVLPLDRGPAVGRTVDGRTTAALLATEGFVLRPW